MKIKNLGLLLAVFILCQARSQSPSPIAQHVVALKASLAASQIVLKQYEWIETTVVSLKGDEKSRKVNRCYYGADGGVAKVPLATPEPEKKKRGLRGRIVANKKEELTDYMQQAVALVKDYVPLNPAMIQAANDAGKASLDILQPGKRVRLNFRDYLKPGDNLAVEIDLTKNRLLGLRVKTYLESEKDAVSLDARMASLNDGTTYSDSLTLNASKKKVQVVVDNSGYRKMSN